MARTYDFSDPAQKAAYIEESVFQWLMYGRVSISLSEEAGLITLYDGAELDTAPGGQGRVLS